MPLNLALDGARVRLDEIHDPYTTLKPGALGTAQGQLDNDDTLLVYWDNGSRLSLTASAGDRWSLVSEAVS